MSAPDLDPWQEIARLQLRVEQVAAKAKSLVRKHTYRDCGCEFCSVMWQAADELKSAAACLADAAKAEREADGATP